MSFLEFMFCDSIRLDEERFRLAALRIQKYVTVVLTGFAYYILILLQRMDYKAYMRF